MSQPQRKFEDHPAIRAAVPLIIGIVGPSGCGKTYSALELATGIQQVTGGDIGGIDTESGRMLQYSDFFKFRHVPFSEPFSPNDYRAAFDHYVRKGVKIIIADSMSHEHSGIGGVIEWQAREAEELARRWKSTPEKVSAAAWVKPKRARQDLINYILQCGATFILCFRAKEKMKPVPGREPILLGWQPEAGKEFVYECTIKILLSPGADGVPTLIPENPFEKQMVKTPVFFRDLFREPRQLHRSMGEAMARWAAGDSAPPKSTIDRAHVESLWHRTVPSVYPKEAWLEEMSRRWAVKSLSGLTPEQVAEWESLLTEWEQPAPSASPTEAEYIQASEQGELV